jgi:hypothetical protein
MSRLTRIRSRHSQDSPYYRQLTPCERGSYYRAPVPRGNVGSRNVGIVDDATVVITSTGGELLETTVSFLDDVWPVYVVDGSEGCYGLPALRHVIEQVSARWAVLLDVDAFVLDNTRLAGVVSWAAHHGHAAVGVPDGGIISHRTHNPNALNLFFNVLNLDAIRTVWDERACRRWIGRGSAMTRLWPPESLLKPGVAHQFDDYEPYYGFYFWLADVGLSTGYLDARDHSDGVSTIVLDQEGQPVVIHSWYGREFDLAGPMRDRILDVVTYARGGPDRCARWRGRVS